MTEAAARAGRRKPLPVHRFLQRHAAFLRRARDTAHQSLFFVGLLHDVVGRPKAREAVDCYRPFALEQIKTLVRGVHLPDHYERTAEALAAGELKADPEERRKVERALAIYREWRRIFELVGDPEIAPGRLEQELFDFLNRSSAESRLEQLQFQGLPSLLFFLRKHLAILWAVFLGLAVLLKIEAVHSLIWNAGWQILLPSALLALPMGLPLLISAWVRWKHPGKVPFWDIGGHSFRRIDYQSLEPGRLIRRFDPRAQPSLPREIVVGQGMRLALSLLAWGFALAIVAARYAWFEAGSTSVTVFLVLSHVYALLIVARIVDFWEFLDARPIRFVLLLATAAILVSLLLGLGREFFIVALLILAPAQAFALRVRSWRNRMAWGVALLLPVYFLGSGLRTLEKEAWRDGEREWKRLTPGEWPWPTLPGEPTSPVVVVAASGGGSRAAVYAGLFFERLEKEFPEIAQEIQAVSSVSGGSLASAAYLSRRLELTSRERELGQADNPEARLQAVFGLSDALSEDFILPTLKGAFMPGQTRSSAIEESWRDGPVHLGSYHLSDLAQEWKRTRGASHPPFPIPLFNTATLDGHDLVVSPLDSSFYTRPELEQAAKKLQENAYRKRALEDEPKGPKDPATWVYYRDGTYALEDLLPKFDPMISSAVRASANFPFGFPLVRIETRKPLFFSPEDRERVYLTDGGALSNSGMWSLFNLLTRPEVQPELKRRGVLLVIVDASRMPSFPTSSLAFNGLVGTIEDQCPIGQRLHREMFNVLGMTYGDRIAIVQLDLVPQESYNVLTTWALDKKSRKTLTNSFERRWKEECGNLRANWEALGGARLARSGETCPYPARGGRPGRIPSLRLPLD